MIYHSKGVTVSPKGQLATINLSETDHALVIDERVKKVRFVGIGTLETLNLEKTSIKEVDLRVVPVTIVVYVPLGTKIKEPWGDTIVEGLDPIPSYQIPIITKEVETVPDTIFDFGTTPAPVNDQPMINTQLTNETIPSNPYGVSGVQDLTVTEDALLRQFLTLGILKELIPTNKVNKVNLEAMLFNLKEVGEDDYGNANSVGQDLVQATGVPPVKLSMYIAALCILTPHTPWALSSILTTAIKKTLGQTGMF